MNEKEPRRLPLELSKFWFLIVLATPFAVISILAAIGGIGDLADGGRPSPLFIVTFYSGLIAALFGLPALLIGWKERRDGSRADAIKSDRSKRSNENQYASQPLKLSAFWYLVVLATRFAVVATLFTVCGIGESFARRPPYLQGQYFTSAIAASFFTALFALPAFLMWGRRK